MHGSGLSHLVDEPLTVEVEGNQIGRAGREDDSLATLLYDVNDAEARLQDLQQRRPELFRPQAMSTTSPAGCPLSERRAFICHRSSFSCIPCPAHSRDHSTSGNLETF